MLFSFFFFFLVKGNETLLSESSYTLNYKYPPRKKRQEKRHAYLIVNIMISERKPHVYKYIICNHGLVQRDYPNDRIKKK